MRVSSLISACSLRAGVRLSGSECNRRSHRHTSPQTNKVNNKQASEQTNNKQTDKQTIRQTNGQTGKQTNKQTNLNILFIDSILIDVGAELSGSEYNRRKKDRHKSSQNKQTVLLLNAALIQMFILQYLLSFLN